MDKPPLNQPLLRKLFDDGMATFHATCTRGEHVYRRPFFGTGCRCTCPEGSKVLQFLEGWNRCDEKDTALGWPSIFLTDGSSPGFQMPEAPFDRFRFTHRGDVAGSEQGDYRVIYLRRPAALMVVNREENRAVILFREPDRMGPESVNMAVIFCLACLIDPGQCLFLPLGTKPSEAALVLETGPLHGPQPLFDALLQRPTARAPQNWTLVKPAESPEALPFYPAPPLKMQVPAAIEGIVLTDLTTDEELTEDDSTQLQIANRLIFKCMSAIPFASREYMHWLEELMFRLPVVSGYSDKNADAPFSHLFKKQPVHEVDAEMSRGKGWTPRLSVIIPAFNAETCIQEAAMSIASIHYPDLELLIIDDGSVDGTAEVVRMLPIPCRYIRQEPAGAAAARNHGLSVSTGEILLFLDADDLVNPKAFPAMLQILKMHENTDGVTGFAQKFTESPDGDKTFQGSPAESFPLYIGGSLFRRRIFERTGNFNPRLRLSEDTDWFVRARENNCLILRTNAISLFVRRHSGSLTASISDISDLQLTTLLWEKTGRSP